MTKNKSKMQEKTKTLLKNIAILCMDKKVLLSKEFVETITGKPDDWIKAGVLPDISILRKIAEYFGVDVSDLMDGIEDVSDDNKGKTKTNAWIIEELDSKIKAFVDDISGYFSDFYREDIINYCVFGLQKLQVQNFQWSTAERLLEQAYKNRLSEYNEDGEGEDKLEQDVESEVIDYSDIFIKIRNSMGWTQHDLALEIGISQQIVSNIESKRMGISKVTLCKIKSFLKKWDEKDDYNPLGRDIGWDSILD